MSASALPELWRALRTRPPRPPIDWQAVRTIAVLAVTSVALIFAGATLVGIGDTRLGLGMIGGGLVALVVAAGVRV